MTLLQSLGEQIHSELILLAPAGCVIPAAFSRRFVDRDSHSQWLSEAQRVRGKVYLEDGAVEAWQLTSDGRHVQPADYDSWHLLSVDHNGEIHGCARYRHHTGNVAFDDLGAHDSWLARSEQWGSSLRAAVESEIARAKQSGKAFSEVGGWAIVPEKRCTPEALRVAMATYSLAQSLGGCLGISTATERHRSSAILRRIGGRSLEFGGTELPSYYDPQYRCRMEVLRFDSNSPNSSCRKWVEVLSQRFADVSVVAAREPVEGHHAQLPQPLTDTWPSLSPLRWVT